MHNLKLNKKFQRCILQVVQYLGNIKKVIISWLTFRSAGNFGNPFNDVSPTLIMLSVSKLEYFSVNPSICCDRQLSRFNSVIWNIQRPFSTFGLLFTNHKHTWWRHAHLHFFRPNYICQQYSSDLRYVSQKQIHQY